MKFLNTHLAKKVDNKNDTLTTVSFLSQINTQKKKVQQEFYTLEDLQNSNKKKLKRFVYCFLFLIFISFISSLLFLNCFRSYMRRLEKVRLFLMLNFYLTIILSIFLIFSIYNFYQIQLNYIKIPQSYKTSFFNSNIAIIFVYSLVLFFNLGFIVLTKMQSQKTVFSVILKARSLDCFVNTIQCVLLCVYNCQRYDLDFSVNLEDETQANKEEENFNGSFALNLSFNKNNEKPFRYKKTKKQNLKLDEIEEMNEKNDHSRQQTPKKQLFKFEKTD